MKEDKTNRKKKRSSSDTSIITRRGDKNQYLPAVDNSKNFSEPSKKIEVRRRKNKNISEKKIFKRKK